MTTHSSQFHPKLPPLLLLVVILAGGTAEEEQPLMRRPDCIDKCGDIDIPFPFGVGPGCFRHGFEVLCNNSRAFLPLNSTQVQEMLDVYRNTTIELVSISVATSKARAYAPVSYTCSQNTTSFHHMDIAATFSVSLARNVLVGVSLGAEVTLKYDRFWAPVSCASVYVSGQTNGSCTVQAPSDFASSPFISWSVTSYRRFDDSWPTGGGPGCSYAMVVEKSWYNFSTLDPDGDKTLLNKYPRGVQFVLDFTAGDTLCPVEGKPPPLDYACVSGNSSCVNATGQFRKDGYFCKCLDHYDGNPYVPNGCQDIDECKLPQVYPCSSGICKNRLGGYDCPCKFGMKGDGKAGTCTDVFPTAAKATAGAAGGILLMVILSFLVILHKEKKKMKQFYEKNGGLTIEKANAIKLYKKGDLKPILKNTNLIGKGCFGEVYRGILDNQLVAIKKPITGSMLESDQFANEVIIQSRVIHTNIVRLIGCCLEVDAPMLVYEFISRGSLHDILHNNNSNVALNLDRRLNIAAQSAEGLAYMHSKAHSTILHGDVKPANILLDDNFVAKISDFGISRLIARDNEHTRSVIGDMNYMDPIYLQEGRLTEKSDVYSFGVVILELISSRRAIHSENNNLVKSFLEAHRKKEILIELFDKEIAIATDLELLHSLVGIAVECLSLDVDQRPTMTKVAERLLKLSQSREA